MKNVKIGRARGNDVVIDYDQTVSNFHCQITQEDDGTYRLVDLDSTNGTFVNGVKRFGEVTLEKTDIVRVGKTTLPWLSYFRDSSPKPKPTGNSPVVLPPRPNFLVWSILATIFCCVPFGIASIVYSSKARGLYDSGMYNEAMSAHKVAKRWFWWAFALGLVVNIIALIYWIFNIGVAMSL